MNCTGVTNKNSHMPQVNQGSASNGTQVMMVAPVASAMKAPARMMARASTPVSAMVTRMRMDFNSCSGDSNVRWQPLLQK